MTSIRSLFLVAPASPGRRTAEHANLEDVSEGTRAAILDALEWSDLDSSKALVDRTDSVLDHLNSGEASPQAPIGGAPTQQAPTEQAQSYAG